MTPDLMNPRMCAKKEHDMKCDQRTVKTDGCPASDWCQWTGHLEVDELDFRAAEKLGVTIGQCNVSLVFGEGSRRGLGGALNLL